MGKFPRHLEEGAYRQFLAKREGGSIAPGAEGDLCFGIRVIALCFGMLTGWWNFLASSKNSELGILIYASGFFATVISMRSLFVFTTALLPTVAALIIGTYAVRIFTSRARQLISRATQPRRRLP